MKPKLLSFKPRTILDKLKEFKVNQSARSQYLAKVKAERAEKTAQERAESFQEAMDMAQAVIDARQKENEMSYTPGLGRMDVFKAYVKRTVKKFKRAIRNLVVVRRIEKIQTDVQSHFRKYKTVYTVVIAVTLVVASTALGHRVGYGQGYDVGGRVGHHCGVWNLSNSVNRAAPDVFVSMQEAVQASDVGGSVIKCVTEYADYAASKAAEIKAAA